MANQRALLKMRELLLLGKTWRYLRYVHAREAMLLAPGTKDVLVVGAGYGIAELALAAEFEGTEFHLTDWSEAAHSLDNAKKLSSEYGLPNVSFGRVNILERPTRTYDMVYSVEVLEHIKGAAAAAQNMREAARKYVFCLVPFANADESADPVKSEHAWKKAEHHVVGYNGPSLEKLFPGKLALRNCYWRDAGLMLRQKLEPMSPEQIRGATAQLIETAKADIRTDLASSMKEALGIWILSRNSK